MKRDPKDQREIRRYILGYLSEHPDAGDTIEGITEWWLRNQIIAFEIQTVARAIASLVAEGLIVERKGRDRVVYKVNRTKQNRRTISKRELPKNGSSSLED